ncbi:MAG: hypothetical protein WAV20_16595 [Blastocatellia bacterium]
MKRVIRFLGSRKYVLYKKTITAYQLSVGITRTMVDTLTSVTKIGIEPGEVAERLDAIDFDPKSKEVEVAVLAVLFDDATSDGDPEFVLEIQNCRIGEMMQVHFIFTERGFNVLHQ